MKKIRVLFPYAEAGMGHIIPLKSIKEAFENKYGDQFEVIDTYFFSEKNIPSLVKFNDLLCKEVRKHNTHKWYGHGSTLAMNICGTRFSSAYVMRCKVRHCFEDSVKLLEEYEPDVVVSSHWATNYYAEHMSKKPLTVMYSPDVIVNKLFQYKCDLVLTPIDTGYYIAMKNKRRFNDGNLKLVNTAIRNEAFGVDTDKVNQRIKLGLDPNKFTVCLTDGGYGIGKIEKITMLCLEKNLPINVIAVCGKNEELYNRLSSLKINGNTNVLAVPFKPTILDYIAASDLFIGKSGANAIAEAVFFAVPVIVSKTATVIETNNAKYYVNDVGCAIRMSSPEKMVEKIEHYLTDKTELETMHNNALKIHQNFGAEKCADEIYNLIMRRK